MKILLDTNIVLDHLLERKSFCLAATRIFSETERGRLTSFISGTTVTTVHYIVTKALGVKGSHSAIKELLTLFEVAPITRAVLTSALLLNFSDYEDAVVHEAAVHAGVQAIITRDIKDFRHASVAVYSSDEFVMSL